MKNRYAFSKSSLCAWMKMLVLVMLTFNALYLPSKAEASSPPCGLTIITHGYQSDTKENGWVSDMAQAINSRMGNNVPIGTIYIIEDKSKGAKFDESRDPDINLTSGTAIILVDWSDVDGGVAPFTVPTSVIGDIIFTYLENHPGLLKVPIHLIGHSRGGSVMSHLSERLGEISVWVDQLTTLDPQPIYDDADLNVYDNVLFADNYYQTIRSTDIIPLYGSPVDNAYNLDITERLPWGYPLKISR